jgi:hypothetical protein
MARDELIALESMRTMIRLNQLIRLFIISIITFCLATPAFASMFGPAPSNAAPGAVSATGSAATPLNTDSAQAHTLLGAGPPYVPRVIDYAIELGLLRADEDNFWIAFNMGFHSGPCRVFLNSHCQQYIDAIVGAGVREAETYSEFLASMRWQYVNYPDRESYFWRVFAGPTFASKPDVREWRGNFGAGVGVTTYLQDKIDLRLETRIGYIDRAYGTALVGVQIKADRLLQQFVIKVKDIGVGTVSAVIRATGTAIKATGEGLGEVVNQVGGDHRDTGDRKEAAPAEKK